MINCLISSPTPTTLYIPNLKCNSCVNSIAKFIFSKKMSQNENKLNWSKDVWTDGAWLQSKKYIENIFSHISRGNWWSTNANIFIWSCINIKLMKFAFNWRTQTEQTKFWHAVRTAGALTSNRENLTDNESISARRRWWLQSKRI